MFHLQKLVRAARAGNVEDVKLCLENGANMDYKVVQQSHSKQLIFSMLQSEISRLIYEFMYSIKHTNTSYFKTSNIVHKQYDKLLQKYQTPKYRYMYKVEVHKQ